MKKCFLLLPLCALLLSGCGRAERSCRQISQEEALQMMAEETDYIILDARTREEHAEARIEDSISVPDEELEKTPLSALPDKDQLILVYCRDEDSSLQAAQKLADAGYTKVAAFGGIDTWPGTIVRDEASTGPALRLSYAAETETDGIHMLVTDYTAPIITATLSNRSGKNWSYGASFSLLMRDEHGAWQELAWPDSIMWIAIAYELADGEDAEIQCDVSGLGTLSAGEYRLCKGALAAPFALDWSN